MNCRVNMSYDTEKHSVVHLGLSNHNEPSDSAYIRKCIEFFEMNKGGAINQHLILERLARIETMLKNGAASVTGSNGDDEGQSYTDDIFDEALEQLE